MSKDLENLEPAFESGLLEPVLTASEMAEIDRVTIERFGLPGMVLMENAGRKVVAVIQNLVPDIERKKVVIVCGKGNNGGDGYVIARYLDRLGARVEVIMTATDDQVQGDAARNFGILDKLAIKRTPYDPESFKQTLVTADLIVDALLGTGVTGPLRGKMADIVASINEVQVPIIAVDLPTGINTDTGAVPGQCVRADHTVTMGCLKRGLLFAPGREHAGQIHVADIGFPALAFENLHISCFLTTHRFVQSKLPKRPLNTFKNRQGQILVLAGSRGMTGAAALCSLATLRVGAGLTILGIPQSLNVTLEQKLTEVMTLPLPETSDGIVSFAAKKLLGERLDWADVVAVGPGLGTSKECVELLRWLLHEFTGKMVIDADGLNCLANDHQVLKETKADLVLTPHPGELSRLIKTPVQEILANPIETAKQAARTLGAVLVVKGGPTVIATPDARTFINPNGNPGMATAGMGDVLTGVVAGLLAQGMESADAAISGVYLHGAAADLAVETTGEGGLIASDVLKRLPDVQKEMEKRLVREIRFC